MSKNNSTVWDRLYKTLTRTQSKDYRLEELIGTLKRGKTESSERIPNSKVLMQRCELMYRLDPLIFAGINKLTRRISGSRIYLTNGDPEEIKKTEAFLKSSNLIRLLPYMVKDAFIYGYGVSEIVKTGRDMHLAQIDPKTFDFLRANGQIKKDAKGNVEGFQQTTSTLKEIKLEPEEVLLIRFYTLGDDCLGISPVEAAFKTSWIRLNLQEALGEAVYRNGFPKYVYHLGDATPGYWRDITPDKIKEAKKVIQILEAGAELVLPWWIKVDVLKSGDTGDITPLLEELSTEIKQALESPFATDINAETDFEKTILAMQEELKNQLQDQLLGPWYKEQKFKTSPLLNFVEYSPQMQTAKLRRLSAYAKQGLLKGDLTLENEIRRAEGFTERPEEDLTDRDCTCVFDLGDCKILQKENLALDKLSAYCNVCLRRLKEEKKLKG
jgi:hypothetical protein